MSSALSHKINKTANGVTSGENHVDHALGIAGRVIGSSKGSAVSSFIGAIPTILKGVNTVAAVVSLVRTLNRDEGFTWFGLARRKGPLYYIATLGAGVAVGVGAGLLLAPMSGADMRRTIFNGIKDR